MSVQLVTPPDSTRPVEQGIEAWYQSYEKGRVRMETRLFNLEEQAQGLRLSGVREADRWILDDSVPADEIWYCLQPVGGPERVVFKISGTDLLAWLEARTPEDNRE